MYSFIWVPRRRKAISLIGYPTSLIPEVRLAATKDMLLYMVVETQ